MAEGDGAPQRRYGLRPRPQVDDIIESDDDWNHSEDEDEFGLDSSGDSYEPSESGSEEQSEDGEEEDVLAPPRGRRGLTLDSGPFPDSDSGDDYDANFANDQYGSSESVYDSDISLESNEPHDPEDGWTRASHLSSPYDRTQPGPEYTGATTGIYDDGPTFAFDRPVEAFKYFIDGEIIDNLCLWTNQRARAFFVGRGNHKVHSLRWTEVVSDDMYIFLALVLLMGIVRMPSRHMYWEHGPTFGGPAIFTGGVMSRNGFNSIMKFLRFSPAQEVDKRRPKTRIQPFLDMLKVRFERAIDPGPNIGIDESLILWKGRLMFKQFIRTKRARFGIKIFFLCPSDPSWDGYSWSFEVYWGAQPAFDAPGEHGLSKSEAVVARLMTNLFHTGRHVFCDSWYSSVRLAMWLWENGTYFTGTINPLRGVPVFLRNETLGKKLSSFARKGCMLVCKYVDRKTLYSITSKFSARVIPRTKKYFRGRAYFNLPKQIDDYNQHMGTVDLVDLKLKYYSSSRKSLAWLKKLGIHFIDRAQHNAYLMFKSQQGILYDKKFMGYIKDVVNGLISEHSPYGRELIEEEEDRLNGRRRHRRRAPRRRLYRSPDRIHGSSSSNDSSPPGPHYGRGQRRRVNENQQPIISDSTDQESSQRPPPPQSPVPSNAMDRIHQRVKRTPSKGKGSKAAKRCRECWYQKRPRKETTFCCSVCPQKPGLCSAECHEDYHRRVHPSMFTPTSTTPVSARTRGGIAKRAGVRGPASRPKRGMAEPEPGTSGAPPRKRRRKDTSTDSTD